MVKPRLTLTVPPLAPKLVARYVHYRVTHAIPGCLVEDVDGPFTYMGRFCPTDFWLVTPEGRCHVTCLEGRVELRYTGDHGAVLAAAVAQDQLWGSDFTLQDRLSPVG